MGILITVRSQETPGPELEINCPKCAASTTSSTSYEQRDRLCLFYLSLCSESRIRLSSAAHVTQSLPRVSQSRKSSSTLDLVYHNSVIRDIVCRQVSGNRVDPSIYCAHRRLGPRNYYRHAHAKLGRLAKDVRHRCVVFHPFLRLLFSSPWRWVFDLRRSTNMVFTQGPFGITFAIC